MLSTKEQSYEGGGTVLPPIVTSEKDRQYLHQLSQYISFELRSIDNTDQEQRYIVYKDAFDKVCTIKMKYMLFIFSTLYKHLSTHVEIPVIYILYTTSWFFQPLHPICHS